MDTSKIIKGVVNSGRYTVTAPIVKEDYGLYLQIEGVELPSTYEVDFSNSENSGTSVTMIGNADGVLIPRQFIDSGKDVFAFLYHVGENFGRTVYKFRIPNKVRPDRTNEEPTPEEQSVIDQAISALNTAVAQTAQDVIDADASAQSASADADKSEEARTDAQNYATQAEQARDDAQTYANNASASATASAQSASQSAQIKADVEDLVDDAQASADASAQSATASANSATTAQGYAQSASASAQSASTSASNASASAQTASTKASEASGYASTASQKATEASQSASQALSYKTDAESAKTASQTAQGLAESARDSAVSAKTDAEQAKEDAETARDEAQSIVDGISGALDDKAPVITDTASGAIASFSDGADDLPLKSLVVDINPIQDLSHGDPSPENICPISGWTSVDVEQSGVNVWDEEWELGDISSSTGENVTSNAVIRTKNYITVKPNTKYYAYINNSGPGPVRSRFYDVNKNYIGSAPKDRSAVAYNQPFITPDNCYYMRFTPQAAYGTTYNHDISINYPSTDHDYHPYTGRSININLGQTVYGGKLDVLSGVLTVDRAMVTVGENDRIEYASNSNGFLFYCTNKSTGAKNNGAQICDRLSWAQGGSASTLYSAGSGFVGYPNGVLYFKVNTSIATVADMKSYLSSAGALQLCYELAEPIEMQLSENQINSLYGVNNIWADSGDTEVEYRADTKLYINKKIAEAISALS